MPKASKVGRFRAAAKASSRNVKSAPLTAQFLAGKKDADDANAALLQIKSEEKETLSRGQRKRLAKREQYLKREKMIMSSLRLQRLEEQKGKLDGLDAIREALGDASHSSKSIMSAAKDMSKSADKTKDLPCNTNKSKKTLANTEISHMGLVLQHPSFKENPFAAIQQHLRNSLAPQAEKLKQDSQRQDEEDKKVTAKKKEERKERIRDAKFSKSKKGFKSGRAKR
mmetsp:Transcript_4322/g.8016  ORF Transcript_4322/g.8016 Transcript_4322/m.8016 type:complete len:226 (+) Transcript_4322:114-791(+)|eukprot:CAMPEP_0183718708 /NCGR_PEP_ID=MMETSP0737-20130205/11887_1 /TAXON_ID=385413 /ORGANISM="Thalassiosira miniscula, Strain CCMP1093" /LENGTH=225 /DNA_ID=CAMNT_0025948317 /DNA_START=129 /DNA_END=806 /DNA_ORIENTATION=-